MRYKSSRVVTVGPVLVAAAALLWGCSQTDLLGVSTPDQITPGAAANASGANAQRIAAIGNFATFYGGDVAGSGVGVNVAAGILSDEMRSARGGTEHLDQRAQNESLFPVTSPWSFAGQAYTQLIRAYKAVEQFVPASATRTTQVAELFALRGYTLLLLAENYCGAVPISDANDASPTTTTMTNAQLYARAIQVFDSVATVLGTTTAANITNLAAVGKARAMLNTATTPAQATAAAAVVAAVPTTFSYNITYSTSTIVNAMYDWMNATLNFAPADVEGGVGLDYVSANDPRVTVQRNAAGTPTPRAGQDGLIHFTQTLHTVGNSPIPLATGVEARLIEAEAALRSGDLVTFMARINAARATRTGLAPLVAPATTRAQEDLLFRERAFWFWGTAHRVGDLRRLMKAPYNRTQAETWPTGAYFKGGTFGTDVSLRPSQAEQNNPNYTPSACNAATP